MDVPIMMDQKTLFNTRMEVESFNRSLQSSGRKVKNTLGKDDFLKLLVTQLQNQDPTKPLEDKEFIAQMAQFSSLEQMTEINRTLSTMIASNKIELSYSLLGKEVEVIDSGSNQQKKGVVEEVMFEPGGPVIIFDGLSYSIDDVTKVSIRNQ